MARINTNIASLTAQRTLAKSRTSLDQSLQRLSTGLKINSGADDPAGLIASEGLRSEISGINQAVENSQRASNVISTAEGSLSEVSNLLLDIKSLIVQSANTGAMSDDEIAANQLQVDSAIQSITRISNTTTFAGLNLLNGSLGYLTSGVQSNAIAALHISQANFGKASDVPVSVNVIASAKLAELSFAHSSITNSVTLNVSGSDGTQLLTFTSGATASSIVYAVNSVADSTGVKAVYITSGTPTDGVKFVSSEYGSKQFVSVTAQSGASFDTTDAGGNNRQRVTGADAIATINGALTTGDGLELNINNSALDMNVTLSKNFGIGQTSFDITGGGALFQLGAQVKTNQQVNIGLDSVAASALGNNDVGFLSDVQTGGNAMLAVSPAKASDIIEKSITQVANLRGRLGAFEKNTLTTNMDSLNVTLENVTASESNIRDADFAEETSNLTRNQILVSAGTSVLSTANSSPQSVLQLLQGAG